jgi:hypothetical protein
MINQIFIKFGKDIRYKKFTSQVSWKSVTSMSDFLFAGVNEFVCPPPPPYFWNELSGNNSVQNTCT